MQNMLTDFVILCGVRIPNISENVFWNFYPVISNTGVIPLSANCPFYFFYFGLRTLWLLKIYKKNIFCVQKVSKRCSKFLPKN